MKLSMKATEDHPEFIILNLSMMDVFRQIKWPHFLNIFTDEVIND
jgi:hypothetical protein